MRHKSRVVAIVVAVGISVCILLFGLSLSADFSRRGPTVTISVQASDTSSATLHYRWRSTDGAIQDVDATTTTWTLPTGPGIHFAYVLVSNGLGGYTERRIAVNTDTIGTPSLLQATFHAVTAPP